MKQPILCLDMESVLTPEIWPNVAKLTGIEKLKLTTADIADYDELMKMRLEICKENNITLSKIQEVISSMDLLPWVLDFLIWARKNMQVVILSDTFIEFAEPFIKKMNYPTIFCHSLVVKNDNIIDYKLRISDQKTKAVKKFKELNFNVIASWDSFNDTWMLNEADFWFFFKPWEKARNAFPNIKIATSYDELKEFIKKSIF